MEKLVELKLELKKIEFEIDLAREQEARLIAERVVALLAEYGITIDNKTDAPRRARRTGTRVAPKYWNPATGATWSGRGRAPLWISGEDRSQFLLPDAQKPE
ncbi:H-NS histone family protein [Paraburkholderia megapolitana]|uniref:H-NS family DNA-binding protein n=1 Tax=Paraburkholderia megapolitana TaxID=420953 RepID=A0A1I3E5Y5_9BURK|nr:H-NS histone family protein [Paraburkholderia megapolitana]QDQ79937.1 H-NS histone family protein [Paraburkholderia megapolitana]SFH94392.1 H-NS family DNA-binding protein [Paraburkholderia megapolitana]